MKLVIILQPFSFLVMLMHILRNKVSNGALLGPFKEKPIAHSHVSPFMTRNKPNSDRSRVIIDLSWPHGAFVNSGIDKDTYLDSVFTLALPTVDHITSEFKRLGRGALLYKIDVSRAFRHMRIDPGDYDLLGLQWRDAYVNTCFRSGRIMEGKSFSISVTLCITSCIREVFVSSIILMITLACASLALRMRHMTVSST